jgi:hypothetical protein
VSAVDRVIRLAAGGTVAVLAAVAGAISYSHMAELARAHGEVGWRAHAFPVSVDGIEVVASLVLLAHRRAGTRAGWLPWAALAAGTAASVAANVAVGASDPVGRIVAGWPAVALLVAIKLLSGLLDGARDGRRGAGDPAGDAAVPAGGPVVPATGAGGTGPGWSPSPAGGAVPAVPGVVGDGLVDAARAVRAGLLSTGGPVNRRTLGEGLRAAGYGVRNDRLGTLLRRLAEEPQDGGADRLATAEAPDGGEGRG